MKKPKDKLPLKVGKIQGEEVILDKNNEIFISGHYDFDYLILGSILELQYIVDAANNFPKALEILKTIKLDAEMALDDRWDRSDCGFQCQIDIVNEFLNKLGNE